MKNKIRLFIDAHVFDDAPQGTRTFVREIYRELIKDQRNYTFFFGAHDIENLRKEIGEHDNVKYIRYISKNKFLRLSVEIPLFILLNRIDIAHFQYVSPLFKTCREIVTTHDVLFLDYKDLFPRSFRRINRFLFRHSATRADILLTVSDYSRSRISEHFKIKSENIHVIPNGVADEYFDYSRVMPDVKALYSLDRYILFVSRIEARKNHLFLLRTFIDTGLWKNGYKLLFIGCKSVNSDPFFNELSSLPEDIRKSIVHIERSYGDELISFYRNCSLFIYPSLAEGFGIPPLEAIASKVPVLCSKTTSMSDFTFLADRFFDPNSSSELSEKISLALRSDPGDFKSDIEYVRENYNWRKSAAKLSGIILDKFNNAKEMSL
jgi:glycosyltransferase involved in cell wall biosynthesis